MFEQTTFLGASVSKFSVNIGWGEQPSNFNCVLVEDRTNGDSFDPPAIGQPCIFRINDWTFQGILERWKKEGGSSGSPIYTVDLVDPREILSGVQIILEGYNDFINVPNIFNVYGYLEQNFGGSQINRTGIPWYLIANSIVTMSQNSFIVGNSYGGSISYQGFSYKVDISELPQLDQFYRVSGQIISLMDFIKQICDLGGRAFFFSLINGTIKLHTVDRNRVPEIGAISDFISSTAGATSKGIGLELRNETTSKMILGADLHELYAASPFPVASDRDSIWPYFGFTPNGSVNVARWNKSEDEIENLRNVNSVEDLYKYKDAIFDGDLTLNLDSRQVEVQGVGETYTTDLDELYAVQSGIDIWRDFLDFRSANRYKPAGDEVKKPSYESFFRLDRKVIGFTEEEVITDAEIISSLKLNQNINLTAIKNRLPYRSVGATTIYIIRKPQYSNYQVVPILTADFAKLLSLTTCLFEFSKFEQALEIYKQTKTNDSSKIQLNPQASLLVNTLIEDIPVFIGYAHNNIPNIHFLKADYLGIFTLFSNIVPTLMGVQNTANIQKFNPIANSPIGKTQAELSGDKDERDDRIQKLFDFLSPYADAVGKKFMISLPFVLSQYDNELGEIRTNYELTDGGYLPEDEYISALQNKMIPANPFGFILPDRRYVCYARFNLIKEKKNTKTPIPRNLDYSELSDDEIYITEDKQFLFVRCDIEPFFVYLDANTGLSARCVVNLPASVRIGEEQIKYNVEYISKLIQNMSPAQVKAIHGKVGGDTYSSPIVQPCIVPDLVVVPLRNKSKSYGPWYAAGANGKVEVEKDESLAPWNYLTYADMDKVGQIKVNSAVTTQTFDETGDVEFPGVPAIQIGAQLIQGGPYITNIYVNVGEEGVTTRYSMQTWTPRLAERANMILERKTNFIQKRMKEQERILRKLQFLNFGNKYLKDRSQPKDRSKTVKSNTSHHVIAGDENGVVIQPLYNTLEQYSENYEEKAIVSLDGIFTPISFGEQNNNLSSVTFPSGMQPGLNSLGLFPFQGEGQHESLVTRGSGIPEDGIGQTSNNLDISYRTIGLKGPLWMAGWGYDTDGQPVPSKTVSGVKSFTDDYNTNMSGWKVGPLLVAWNEQEKGWGINNNAKIVQVKHIGQSRTRFFESGIIFPHIVQGYPCQLILPSGNSMDMPVQIIPSSGDGPINMINFRDNLLVEDSYYLANIVDGNYIIDNQSEWREFV